MRRLAVMYGALLGTNYLVVFVLLVIIYHKILKRIRILRKKHGQQLLDEKGRDYNHPSSRAAYSWPSSVDCTKPCVHFDDVFFLKMSVRCWHLCTIVWIPVPTSSGLIPKLIPGPLHGSPPTQHIEAQFWPFVTVHAFGIVPLLVSVAHFNAIEHFRLLKEFHTSVSQSKYAMSIQTTVQWTSCWCMSNLEPRSELSTSLSPS